MRNENKKRPDRNPARTDSISFDWVNNIHIYASFILIENLVFIKTHCGIIITTKKNFVEIFLKYYFN
jgi:hypothetical protein